MKTSQGALVYGDVRYSKRLAWLTKRIVETGTLVLHHVGGNRRGEIAAHRFLSSKKVNVEMILAPDVALTARTAGGRRILAVQDTTEINFAGRDRSRTGLGPSGNGASKGFFIHPVIAVDAADEAVIGPVAAHIWTRNGKPTRHRRGRAFEHKESVRWLDSARAAAEQLREAAQACPGPRSGVIVVGDRESDIYLLFARRPERVDLLVRAAQDRTLGQGGLLNDVAASWAPLGVQEVQVASKGPGDKGRVAKVVLKAGKIELLRPKGCGRKSDPKSLTLGFVEAREIDAPKNAEPLLWRLITTLPVGTREEAEEAVRFYRSRWRIEEVFRTLKRDGLNLEATQVETAGRLMNLAALGLIASCRIIQLVDARDGSRRPATDALAADRIEAAAHIGATLEGRTERQKNPWDKGTLAWLAWIVARLGGWNCYYKPPGPKTMARGWRCLCAMLDGFALARELQDMTVP